MPRNKDQSPLSDADLAHFRSRLLEKREEVLSDVAELQREGDEHRDRGDLADLADHIGDMSVSSRDEDLIRRLAENERKLLIEIDDALRRLENGSFGLCEVTGKPISRERLDAMPWARRSVEAERAREPEAPIHRQTR